MTFNAPTAVTATCTANQDASFSCPLMILTTHTALSGRAGGYAQCTNSLDTGIISGTNTAQRTGNLGRAFSIICEAYSDSIPLVPEYNVTCSEPGLPTPAL